MPELPEVENILLSIKKKIINKKILYTKIYCIKLRWIVSKEIVNLKNKTILNVKRLSKYIIFKFRKGYILLHLGMSGHLKLISNNYKNKIPNKHDHIDLFISNNKIIRYHDPRKFGFFLWIKDLNHKFLNKLGPEPLSDNLNAYYLFKKSRKTKQIIKNWLMKNTVISGIGNIYANEILFKSKILPYKITNTINYEECLSLSINIKKVLKLAIRSKGTTIKNFFNTNQKPGRFNKYLKVYQKSGENCTICNSTIQHLIHNKRKTYFCIKCQK